MQTIDIKVAQPDLINIVHHLHDQPVVLSENGQPVAMLVPCPKSAQRKPRVPGCMKGEITMKDNFDDPLPEEYRDAFGL